MRVARAELDDQLLDRLPHGLHLQSVQRGGGRVRQLLHRHAAVARRQHEDLLIGEVVVEGAQVEAQMAAQLGLETEFIAQQRLGVHERGLRLAAADAPFTAPTRWPISCRATK